MQETGFVPQNPGLQALIEEFSADVSSVERRYRLSFSSVRIDRMDRLSLAWEQRLDEISFGALDSAGHIDHALLRNRLGRLRQEAARDRETARRLSSILPFAPLVEDLEEGMTSMETAEPTVKGQTLDRLAQALKTCAPPDDAVAKEYLGEMHAALGRWREFYQGYDPVLDWWIREPLGSIQAEFERLRIAPSEGGTIPGRPVGREALLEDLAYEMVPYSPEELIAMGEREYSWCVTEMQKAASEMGLGDDWRAALERVKETFLPPGAQPEMVKNLALEAIEFVSELVTVPELAKETWRMEMMAPDRQKVNPFFLGGETIVVSYPADSMTHEEKRMSMRGNNPNFSRATVQHELIPGHHLQMYMTDRYRKYRQIFSTPFWIEGWTLYWELLLWELHFPRTPEERVGMLFWRMHRCVRVSFSLRFHLGELTTQECVDILVDRVGHERLNAEGEVRRSFNGLYPPLYQAAYMIGGLQFQALSRELRGKGWTFRQFHDAIMHENEMPPALMRLALLGESPEAAAFPVWRFDG